MLTRLWNLKNTRRTNNFVRLIDYFNFVNNAHEEDRPQTIEVVVKYEGLQDQKITDPAAILIVLQGDYIERYIKIVKENNNGDLVQKMFLIENIYRIEFKFKYSMNRVINFYLTKETKHIMIKE